MAALSLVLHGAVVLAVHAHGGLLPARSPGSRAAAAAAEAETGPMPSCEADEALAGAARLFVCTLPSAGGAGCVRQALDGFAAGRRRCDTVELPAAVTLIDPRAVEEIEPEPLAELIDPEVLEQIQRAQVPPPPQAAEPPQQQPAPPRELDSQVVEITPPESQEAPEHARLLAEHDSRVDQQTVARGTTEEMVARPEPSAQELDEIPQPDRQEAMEETAGDDADADEGPGRLTMRAVGLPETAREARPEVTPGVTGGSDAPVTENGIQTRRGTGEQHEQAREAADPRRGEQGGGGGGGRTLPNLRPDDKVLERIVGGGSVDHLEDVAEGEVTALNTKQWKFASFFNRAKRQVAQRWNPNRVVARHDPTGKVLGRRDRVTVLRITLDPDGTLTDVVVVRSSGFDALDEEAMRAFRAAQPFPNPPVALVRAGRIEFEFGFNLQMVQRSTWKLFR